MILVRNWIILKGFFLDKIVKGNVFGDVLYDKQPILDKNWWLLKRRKIEHFQGD